MITLTLRSSRMRRTLFVIAITCLATSLASLFFVATADRSASPKTRAAEPFGKLPLSFEVNTGQTDQSVKFLSRGPGYDLFLTTTDAVLTLRRSDVQERSVLRLKLIGANSTTRVEGQDELAGKVNYFAGNNPEKWRRNIPTYRKVHYKDIYSGIDMVYYGNQRELEYDFVVAPGVDPKVIKFRVEGADRIRLDQAGSLLLTLKHGEVRLNKPVIYQVTAEGRRDVKGAYVIDGNEVRFKVRAFDSSKPLVIDPVLSYSTYLGGSGNDQAFSIAVDSEGSAYVTGVSTSPAFPTTPGALKTQDFDGAFVTKLDPTGSTLIYSTYLSGSGGSSGTSIAVDAAGNAYITGQTTTSDFPFVNGVKGTSSFYKTTDGASNWSNNNTGLLFNNTTFPTEVLELAVAPTAPNTIYAGNQHGPYRSTDGGATWTKTPITGLPSFLLTNSIAVDPTNAAVVYIGLQSDGVFKSIDGGDNWSKVNVPLNDAVVASVVFDPVTKSTMYVGSSKGVFKSTDSGSTWAPINNFGTANAPNVRTIAIDPVTPTTIYAGTFGDGGLYKSTNGGSNWTLMNSGMSGGDFAVVNAIVFDPSNPATIYVGHGFSGVGDGIDKSTNGGASWTPINNGVPQGEISAMVADRTNPSVLYAATTSNGIIKTTNGGASWTKANAGLWQSEVRTLVAHPSNPAILFAGTFGRNSTDAFVSKLNASGSELLFSTYLGGSETEIGNGIAVDGSGNIYVAGNTNSTDFPTLNAFQSAPAPVQICRDGFVTKLNPAVPSLVFSTYLSATRCDDINGLAIDSSANVYVIGSTNSLDFPVANAFQGTIGDTTFGDAFVTKLTSSGSMIYSTYFGGNSGDSGFGIAADAQGNAYITGSTASTDFPTVQATPTFGAFVSKLNSQGSALVYSTYLSGGAGRAIAIDSTGNAYIAGITSFPDFPLTAGAIRTKSAVYKSNDGAANWSNENYGLTGNVTDLVVHPTQPSTVYAGTLLGLFKTTNGGRTWTVLNNGFTHSVVAIVIDPLTPSTIYVAGVNSGSNTNGVYKSIDGGNSWQLRANGMTNTNLQSLAIDPVTPTTLYAGAAGGPIFKTTDGGDHWAPSGNVPPFFPVSLAVDPHDHSRIFAAESSSAGGIFRSIDAGASWQSVGLAQTGAHAGFVGVSPLTPNLVYAITTGRGIFRSTDGGDNWSQVMPLSPSIGKIVFDPVSSSTLYYFSNIQGVLKTTDNGQNWALMNKGFSVPSATALAINPLKPSTLYVGSHSAFDEDAFVTKINPAGNSLIYSTFLGGVTGPNDSLNTNDEGLGIAVDSAGDAYVTGIARSPFFPTTPNSYQPLNRGFSDAFISKVAMSHIISGQVLEGGSVPVSGAEVILSDGASITSAFTENDGSYEFSHLPAGGSFTVSASKPHFNMAPPSQSFSNLNSNQTLNFVATPTNAPFFTISGQITNNGAGLSAVTVTLSGSQSGIRTTDDNGNYSFELLNGGNYTVTPSVIGFAFGPTSQTFNNLSASQIANFTANRQSFVVTTANDHGTGSLREAINNANATGGADTITFNIPGSGVKVISLLAPLPEITEPVVIDATTQPGYAGAPLIEIDGKSASHESGFVITAGGTTVRGLAIYSFANAGIFLRDCNNNVIQGNYIGIDATGNVERPNSSGIRLFNSSNNIIGGTTAAARNVISGNAINGVELGGAGNIIQGNFIGTNSAGTTPIANTNTNTNANGVFISGASSTNNLITGNLISGNGRGISIQAPGNTIQGNLIGTDFSGMNRVPNAFGIEAVAANTLIGGLTVSARNVISGNGADGIIFGGDGSKLQGNFIGTDITGTFALGNGDNGVIPGNNVSIGGTVSEARNVISANGVNISLRSTGVIVQGNYIGTDVTGTRALSESTGPGLFISGTDNLIGGLVPGAQNVISGNSAGIRIGPFFSFPQGNIIQGNLIGLNALGTGPLPNVEGGIEVFDAFNTTVGGTQSEAANKIAYNGGPGVWLTGGMRTTVRGNAIFSNGGLGIDLGDTGIAPNDAADSDDGANKRQNFPVLTSVMSIGNSTTIQGSLNSIPNSTFQIDFYSNAALDPSGNGEGALFFGSASVSTDGNGDAAISATFPLSLVGRVVTATATDLVGNTSEFSAGNSTGAAGNVQFSVSSIQVIEDVGLATITVLRKGGSTGSLTVDYATEDGTAIGGQDYTSTSGTLSFSGGETSKSFQIPILDDATTELDETFKVVLRNASSLESVGAPGVLVVTIQDRATVPFVQPNNAAVVEGDAGTTTEMLFAVNLSAATGRTVSVNYATSNLTATGGASCNNPGVDYETTSGTLTFQPGNTSLTIPVKICGDSNAEAIETFRVTLSGGVNASADVQARGEIFNDDALQLILEESGPTFNQAAALTEMLHLRDPFQITLPEWFPAGPDRNTRVMLFARNLQLDPGESASAVTVRLIAGNNQFFDVPAEDVRPVPDSDLTHVIFRLPDNLAAGSCSVTVRAHGRTSNPGTIRISQ
jgi:parallel beta-helix repeat protein